MRTTKLELQQSIARKDAELEQLRAELSCAKADIDRLQSQLMNVTEVASAVNAMRRSGVDPVVEARRAAMAAARDIAMRTRSCIKVES